MKLTPSAKRIMEVAMVEFGKNGYLMASTNRIYPLAGVSKGTIFKIFRSKANLFYELFQKALNDLLEEMERQSFFEIPDLLERMVGAIFWKVAYAQTHPYETAVMFEAISSPPEEIKAQIATHMSDLTKLSVQVFFEDISMEGIREDYSKEEVLKNIEISLAGLQARYLNRPIDMAYLDSIRDESIKYMKTVLRGMEK